MKTKKMKMKEKTKKKIMKEENTENIRNIKEYVQAQYDFCYFDPPKAHANL